MHVIALELKRYRSNYVAFDHLESPEANIPSACSASLARETAVFVRSIQTTMLSLYPGILAFRHCTPTSYPPFTKYIIDASTNTRYY